MMSFEIMIKKCRDLFSVEGQGFFFIETQQKMFKIRRFAGEISQPLRERIHILQ